MTYWRKIPIQAIDLLLAASRAGVSLRVAPPRNVVCTTSAGMPATLAQQLVDNDDLVAAIAGHVHPAAHEAVAMESPAASLSLLYEVGWPEGHARWAWHLWYRGLRRVHRSLRRQPMLLGWAELEMKKIGV